MSTIRSVALNNPATPRVTVLIAAFRFPTGRLVRVSDVQTLMQYATIRAPFDGLVTRRWVDPGAFIQPAEANSAARPVLSLVHIDTVRILVDLPLADVDALGVGNKAVFDRLPALPGRRFPGEVTRFVPAVEPRSRMMRIEIDLKNPDGALRPGYYGYVTLELERLEDTPWVPASALRTEEKQLTTPDGFSQVATTHHVFVVADGTARRRDVTINYDDGQIVGIASGLQAGEEVVVSGVSQLRDGQKVETSRSP